MNQPTGTGSAEDRAVQGLQQEVLAAMRAGMGFATAHKEGGTHLFHDGRVFVRKDYGDQPNIRETYPSDEAFIQCLRQFHDWNARRDVYPDQPPELAVWQYIRSRLVRRRV